jgi:hypothetical protein
MQAFCRTQNPRMSDLFVGGGSCPDHRTTGYGGMPSRTLYTTTMSSWRLLLTVEPDVQASSPHIPLSPWEAHGSQQLFLIWCCSSPVEHWRPLTREKRVSPAWARRVWRQTGGNGPKGFMLLGDALNVTYSLPLCSLWSAWGNY